MLNCDYVSDLDQLFPQWTSTHKIVQITEFASFDIQLQQQADEPAVPAVSAPGIADVGTPTNAAPGVEAPADINSVFQQITK